MNPELISILRVPLQGWAKKDASYLKRLANIKWVEHLDRTSLAFMTHERGILMHTTPINEKIYLQYPGKESSPVTMTGRARKADAVRPWDFRPKTVLSTGVVGRDLSFGHIWSVLYTNSQSLARAGNQTALKVLAMLFYRMAFMVDHSPVNRTHIARFNIEGDGPQSEHQAPHDHPLFLYHPPQQAISIIPAMDWCGMSLEAFLYYNDFLAWNEDCKYYYRDTVVNHETGWINATGRMNTILTHLRFLGCCLNLVPLAEVFEDFSRGKGVSPASKEDISNMCPEFLA